MLAAVSTYKNVKYSDTDDICAYRFRLSTVF